MSKRQKESDQKKLRFRTLLLGVSGLVALAVFIFQCWLVFCSGHVTTQKLSPWMLLQVIPLLTGLFLGVLAILNYKGNSRIKLFLDHISRARTVIAMVTLAFFMALVYLLRLIVDPADKIITMGMSSIGLLLYSLAFIFCMFAVFRKDKNHQYHKDRFLMVTMILILITWLIMALTRFGLAPDTAFWNVAGVPGMWISLAGIILFVLLLNELKKWIDQKKRFNLSPKVKVILEIAVVLVIWMSAALLWIKSPYSNSYFITDPVPPDGHYWPKSDARLMDLGGQYLIIGGKLETPYFTEKPFYALFLGLLHFVFGQSYQTITNIQIMFLALIPVLLYILGKELFNRYLGISLAAFAIIKEIVSLYATYKISVSNARLMMTEMPSALLLLILATVLVKWLKQENGKLTLPLLTGIIIGVACFVRSNFLVVLFVLVVVLFLIGIKALKQRLPQLGMMLLGFLVVILPWVVYNQVNYCKDPLTWKVQAALTTRFNESKTGDRDESPKPTKTPEPSPIFNKPQSISKNSLFDSSKKTVDEFQQGFYKGNVSKVAAHFLNNHVKSLFVLPFQIYPAHLATLLDQPYWNEKTPWQGHLPVDSIIAFLFNLSIIALGMTYAWRKNGWAGLVPLLLMESYYLSNALVRTSGSRYLVPADWVIYTYFFLGLFIILNKTNLLSTKKPTKPTINPSFRKSLWVVLLLGVLLGSSLPVLNLSFPERYQEENNQQVYNRLPLQKIQNEIGITPEEIQAFIQKPNNTLLFGREIYPAYHEPDELFNEKALTFTLLTPKQQEIILPFGRIENERLPVGEDMIAIGCNAPISKTIKTYFVYFVQSDKLIWSDTTTFKDICNSVN